MTSCLLSQRVELSGFTITVGECFFKMLQWYINVSSDLPHKFSHNIVKFSNVLYQFQKNSIVTHVKTLNAKEWVSRKWTMESRRVRTWFQCSASAWIITSFSSPILLSKRKCMLNFRHDWQFFKWVGDFS